MLTRKTAKLSLNQLEDRWNPAELDLIANTQIAVNGGILARFGENQSAVKLETFLAIKGDANLSESGLSTNGPSQFTDVVKTHAVRLADLPRVTIGSDTYVEFLLEVQESRKTPLISLDSLMVFTAPVDNLTNIVFDPTSGPRLGNQYSPGFNLDDGSWLDGALDNWVKLDDSLSGRAGDVLFYVKESTLAANEFVYLYSAFGAQFAAGYGNDGNAEVWSHGVDGSVSPATAATIAASDLFTPPPPPAPPPADTTSSGDSGTTSGDDGTLWL